MALKNGLEKGKNYFLISQANWMKIFSGFGGAPEIPIFAYNVETKIEKPDGEIETKKIKVHDFEPIKVKVYMTHQGGQDFMADQFQLLVSKHLTVHQIGQFMG